MKYSLLISVFSLQLFATQINCQNHCNLKNDFIWILGHADDTLKDNYGGCEINFSSHPPNISKHKKPINAPFQNASICTDSGLLALYSNGCVIINGLDEPIENSDTLNPGEVNNTFCPELGYRGFQDMLIIPAISDSNQYYVFHIDKVINHNPNPPFVVHSANLYYTLVDVAGNGGFGSIIEKHKLIVNDTGLLGCPLTAVKHGNGRDWWILTPDRWSNGFYTVILDSAGTRLSNIQFVGLATNANAPGGQGKFSPDGTKFAWYHPLNGLFLYDFDRITGELSNFERIEIPNVDFISGGCEFSPSSKLLYVNHDTSLFQLDITETDIQSSLIKIADYDGFGDPLPTYFFFMERTPDQRIIMNVLNGSQYLHVIQEPDKRGVDCRFEQHSIKLPTVNSFTLPHFPNFRLGSIFQDLCDSIPVSAHEDINDSSIIFKLNPNPASEFITIESENIWRNEYTVSIFNSLGHLTLSSKSNKINTEWLSAGVYFVIISDNNKLIFSTKLCLLR